MSFFTVDGKCPVCGHHRQSKKHSDKCSKTMQADKAKFPAGKLSDGYNPTLPLLVDKPVRLKGRGRLA